MVGSGWHRGTLMTRGAGFNDSLDLPWWVGGRVFAGGPSNFQGGQVCDQGFRVLNIRVATDAVPRATGQHHPCASSFNPLTRITSSGAADVLPGSAFVELGTSELNSSACGGVNSFCLPFAGAAALITGVYQPLTLDPEFSFAACRGERTRVEIGPPSPPLTPRAPCAPAAGALCHG